MNYAREVTIGLLFMAVMCLTPVTEAIPGTIQNSLSVDLQILRQDYCHNDNELFSIFLKIRLHFINNSSTNIILSRWIKNPTMVRVAATPQLGNSGVFEDSGSYEDEFMPSTLLPSFRNVPDRGKFAVLKPRETFETTIKSVVIGTNSGMTQKGMLAKGLHYLQLGISTWPYSSPENQVTRLSESWSAFGRLQTGLIYSGYTPLTIPESFSNPRCK
jgi:hypothetical protein